MLIHLFRQNMTWNGKLGFEERPSKPINITLPDLMYQSLYDDDLNGAFYGGLDGPQGTMGVQVGGKIRLQEQSGYVTLLLR